MTHACAERTGRSNIGSKRLSLSVFTGHHERGGKQRSWSVHGSALEMSRPRKKRKKNPSLVLHVTARRSGGLSAVPQITPPSPPPSPPPSTSSSIPPSHRSPRIEMDDLSDKGNRFQHFVIRPLGTEVCKVSLQRESQPVLAIIIIIIKIIITNTIIIIIPVAACVQHRSVDGAHTAGGTEGGRQGGREGGRQNDATTCVPVSQHH
ncbi:unnamed protein product [Pleuronectes platessa]|uniref:Uncharacterized protein n=1 Tax=Pleuronectes platessa TaxID=8262 RepID=A0A9N7UZ51_PLEPL|nr:unnamed protein product [Pleuronectes platessa]